MPRISIIGLSALFLMSCGKTDDSAAPGPYERPDCDPLDPSVCLLPFPSSFFQASAETSTGHQIDFGPTTLPENRDDVPWNPAHWNEKDGFSISASMITWFDDLSLDGIISHTDIDRYLDADARTVLIDAQTGERIPHFGELDATVEDKRERVLMLRPMQILDYNRRYVVGIRGLKRNDGTDVEISPAFADLRDGKQSLAVAPERQAHFDADVFPILEDAGFARDELQIAWDFHTVSRENSLGRMEWLRDDMYARIGDAGPAYAIDEITDGDCNETNIARTIHGTMTVPLYTEEDAPGTILTRDANGWPFYNGDTNPDFTLQIPCSVANNPGPAPVIQLGHGFFGNKGEAKSGFLRELADREGWLILATDMTGMSDDDMGQVTLMFSEDPSRFAEIPERTMQGFVEALAANRMVRGALADDPAMTFDDETGTGISVVDPTTTYFYGISMGGILGGAYVAMSPDIERAVFSVSGTPFSMLTALSVNFIPFFLLLQQKYTDGREISTLQAAVQMLWDPGESAGWVHDMNRDVPPGMPTKQVLIQTAIHDSQVTTLGGQLQARSYGASLVAPAARPVFGLDEREAPFEGSALVEWRYTDVGHEPLESVPAGISGNTHNCPRNEPLGMDQVAIFLKTGRVEQTCDGPCEATLADCE